MESDNIEGIRPISQMCEAMPQTGNIKQESSFRQNADAFTEHNSNMRALAWGVTTDVGCDEPRSGLFGTELKTHTNNIPTVTVEEARNGLMKVIAYLQAHPPVDNGHMSTLWNILDDINNTRFGRTTVENDYIDKESIGDDDSNEAQTSEHILHGNQNEKTFVETEHDKGLDLDVADKITAKHHISMVASNDGAQTGLDDIKPRYPITRLTRSASLQKSSMRKTKSKSSTHKVYRGRVKGVMVGLRKSEGSMCSVQKVPHEGSNILNAKHICIPCGIEFKSLGMLNRHNRLHQGKKLKVHQCVLCDTVCENSKGLKKHMEAHKQHKCSQCGHGFTCNAHLIKHMKQHSKQKQHTCKFCRRIFENSDDLNEHIAKHTGMDPYICTTCNETFSKGSLLSNHLMKHVENRPYKCKLCEKSYIIPRSLTNHNLKHHGVKEHTCSICGKCFSNSNILGRHMMVHTTTKKHVCKVCGKAFRLYTSMYQHFRKHSAVKPYACTKCEERFWLVSDLTKHLHVHRANLKHSPGEETTDENKKSMKGRSRVKKPAVIRQTCPICDAGFNSAGMLNRHMHCHEGKKLQVHECAVCNLKCENAKSLKKHMEGHKLHECKQCGRKFDCNGHLVKHMTVHDKDKEKLHVCRFCYQQFRQGDELAEHINTHKGVEPYLCTTCNLTFSRSNHLRTHTMQHGDNRPYKCNLCDKAYMSANGLKVHSLKHEGIREHMCSTCGKCFFEYSTLQKHLVVHTQEKNHTCNICGMTFMHYAGMYVHMRRHSGEKPHACTMCDKRFLQLASLTNHMRVHTGQRPFTCETCGKQFTQETNLRRHHIIHTGTKPYACSVCGQGFTQSSSRKLHMKNVHGIHGPKPDIKVSSITQKETPESIVGSYDHISSNVVEKELTMLEPALIPSNTRADDCTLAVSGGIHMTDTIPTAVSHYTNTADIHGPPGVVPHNAGGNMYTHSEYAAAAMIQTLAHKNEPRWWGN